jgi:four helix bundle protein
MTHARQDLLIRIRKFSVSIIRLFGTLPPRVEAQIIGKQMLRSATSVGAHLYEAHRGRSIAEMISKIEVGLQELEETRYWLLLLIEAEIIPTPSITSIQSEAQQLTAILVTSIKTLKNRTAQNRINPLPITTPSHP